MILIPKCQAMARSAWVTSRENELPQTDYFHVVFTIPPALKTYALRNKKVFYTLMFRAASSTLSQLGADPRYLGGTIGIIAILHTWTQTLSYHPHIHCIVPAGALAPDGVEWIPSREKFLFPAEVVKQLYRGKMMAYFREAVKEGAIAMLPESDGAPGSFRKVVDALYTENWVVYLKESIASPGSIIKYLASYINRIAISDRRIVEVDGDHVTFRYIDRSDGNAEKLLTIPLADFVSRFLLHAVPSGFVRVRYYGFLSNRNRGENMARCRAAVSGEPEAIDQEEASVAEEELNAAETVPSFPVCPHCRSRKLTLAREIPKRSGLLYQQVA
ncbi:MAG: transposase [Chitinispirillaceae bacterium]